MDHKIILKCRVCLDENNEEDMFDLFKPAEDKKSLKLHQKVEFCCGVRIRDSTELPSKICIKCFDMTRVWYNFRQLCINSQVYLESLCEDSAKPPELTGKKSEDEYLKYLLKDLQTFRKEERHANHAYDTIETDSSSESENAGSEEGSQFEAVKPDSEPELQDLITVKGEKDMEVAVETIEKKEEVAIKTEKEKTAPRKSKRRSQKKRFEYRPPSPTSYMCSICGNVYSKKSSFTYHMSLHNDIKPHECELCGKAFRQVCELRNHMRRHTGERPFKCSYCDRHFIDRSEKHRHERVHTNTRPYVCNVCGKSFMHSAILKNHSKLHSGEKDFNCLVCDKAFTLQHQLKAHLQTLTHKVKESQFVTAGYEVVYE